MTKRYLFFIITPLLAVAFGLYAYHQLQSGLPHSSPDSGFSATSESVPEPAPLSQAIYTPAPPMLGDPAGSNRYTNAQFKFSLLYPNDLSVKEYKEENNSISVTFEDATGEKAFEVYVTPFGGAQITDAHFRVDEPSGVRIQPTDVMIDGARATMFFSKNPQMGDTRDVWFIHGGFLYEVATFKELDAWLAQIMTTWRFSD